MGRRRRVATTIRTTLPLWIVGILVLPLLTLVTVSNDGQAQGHAGAEAGANSKENQPSLCTALSPSSRGRFDTSSSVNLRFHSPIMFLYLMRELTRTTIYHDYLMELAWCIMMERRAHSSPPSPIFFWIIFEDRGVSAKDSIRASVRTHAPTFEKCHTPSFPFQFVQ